jgi:hypothetical protein
MFKISCRTEKRELLKKPHHGGFEAAYERMMKLRNRHRVDNGMARFDYDAKYVWYVSEATI